MKILALEEGTINTYEKSLKSLIKDKNYLKLLEGKDIQEVNFIS